MANVDDGVCSGSCAQLMSDSLFDSMSYERVFKIFSDCCSIREVNDRIWNIKYGDDRPMGHQ